MASGGRDTRQYDTTYGRFADELYASIRRETCGEDIGQNSWLTADELRAFCEWLELGPSSELLEVASGSGGTALFTAAKTGCRVTGVDMHATGVAAGNEAARERGSPSERISSGPTRASGSPSRTRRSTRSSASTRSTTSTSERLSCASGTVSFGQGDAFCSPTQLPLPGYSVGKRWSYAAAGWASSSSRLRVSTSN